MARSADGWYSFGNGASLGAKGSEAGVLIEDEEYSAAARISLEQGTSVAPFAITCGVYGRLMHTRYFAAEAEARLEYGKMKDALREIVDGFDSEDGLRREHARQSLYRFVNEFPT